MLKPLKQLPRALSKFSPDRELRLLTLAIETSCDDTGVAVLETRFPELQIPQSTARSAAAKLHFHARHTSNSRQCRGIHPLIALDSHQHNLASSIQKAIRSLPEAPPGTKPDGRFFLDGHGEDFRLRRKPDFISVTRGPGMVANLETGVDTAKGLAVAWQIPLVGVHHMEAHTLTPRLMSALASQEKGEVAELTPKYPFLTMLISGGHTMLVLTEGLSQHRVLASTLDESIGVAIDKTARDIIPHSSTGDNTAYGAQLESFAFPNGETDYHYTAPKTKQAMLDKRPSGYDWQLQPLLSAGGGGRKVNAMAFSFSGLRGAVHRVLNGTHLNPRDSTTVTEDERRVLARETMRVAFEHLTSRVLLALADDAIKSKDISTLVVSGGVASNMYLRHVMSEMLKLRWSKPITLVFPPVELCTDNAAMIAWTGTEMFLAGKTDELNIIPIRKWPLDDLGSVGSTTTVANSVFEQLELAQSCTRDPKKSSTLE